MNKKLLTSILGVVLVVALVAAVSYYTIFTVNLNVNQPIQVTGEEWYSELDLDGLESGDVVLKENKPIRISNNGDTDRDVVITTNFLTGNSEEVDVSYVGILELTKKNTDTWAPLEGEGTKMQITYTVVGDEFEFSGVPEGYTLIYYKDTVVELGERLENPQPAIIVEDNIGSLAQENDANIDELADYTQEPDEYAHAKGAKLWVVLTTDIVDGNLVWGNWDEFYFETDLIWYSDSEDTLTVPANSFIEFYPRYEMGQYAEGKYQIKTTVA